MRNAARTPSHRRRWRCIPADSKIFSRPRTKISTLFSPAPVAPQVFEDVIAYGLALLVRQTELLGQIVQMVIAALKQPHDLVDLIGCRVCIRNGLSDLGEQLRSPLLVVVSPLVKQVKIESSYQIHDMDVGFGKIPYPMSLKKSRDNASAKPLIF